MKWRTRLKVALLSSLDSLRHRLRVRSWNPKQATGRRGEDLAHRYLQQLGFTIVARNFHLAAGEAEADLIAVENTPEGQNLVIVEVKTRESDAYGPPDRAIGPDKQRHLIRVARAYARQSGADWARVRIDVASVVLTNPPQLALYRRAVDLPN